MWLIYITSHHGVAHGTCLSKLDLVFVKCDSPNHRISTRHLNTLDVKSFLSPTHSVNAQLLGFRSPKRDRYWLFIPLNFLVRVWMVSLWFVLRVIMHCPISAWVFAISTMWPLQLCTHSMHTGLKGQYQIFLLFCNVFHLTIPNHCLVTSELWHSRCAKYHQSWTHCSRSLWEISF